jgi:hypothetical protein
MTGDDADAEPEPPRSFVEPFLARERAAREVLDELSADLLMGKPRPSGRRLRELAAADHGTFLTCCLCCNGNDQFLADIAERFDDDTADRLRELGERYDGLTDEFRIVRDEVDMGRRTPSPGSASLGATVSASRCRSSATSSTPARWSCWSPGSPRTRCCRWRRSWSAPRRTPWRTPSNTRTRSTRRS